MLALIVRWFLHRLINRVVAGATSNPVTKLMNRGAAAAAADRSGQRARTLGSVLRSLCTAVVGVTAMIMVLGEFGVDLAPILASAGIVGIAVGFGAQNLVKDFLSGMFMLFEDQYGVGDIVDVGQASGTVETVGLRITTLRDVNGTLWYVRNGEILRVGNKSQGSPSPWWTCRWRTAPTSRGLRGRHPGRAGASGAARPRRGRAGAGADARHRVRHRGEAHVAADRAGASRQAVRRSARAQRRPVRRAGLHAHGSPTRGRGMMVP